MTISPESQAPQDLENKVASVHTDTLALSVMLMLGVTVLQRGIGFFRGVLFCGMLQDDELGRWSLAFSFLVLAAPLAMLGLPGSLGRYVEHFRQRGQLRTFIVRLSWISSLLCGAAITVMVFAPHSLAWLIFGDEKSIALVYWLAAALGCVILFNFLTELFTALRQTRVVSLMQLTASLLFALIAVLLMWGTSLRESAVIIAFAASSLVASLLAVVFLLPLWRGLQTEAVVDVDRNSFWKRLAPFAAGIWLADLLGNLFDVTDRLMLVHFASMSTEQVDVTLGQYHAARIIPVLLVVLVQLFARIVLPYLAEAWEQGRRQSVAEDLRLTLKSVSVVSLVGGTGVLFLSPFLYQFAFGNKFEMGITVLPLVLTVCVWFSLSAFLHSYLQCAEKAQRSCIALACGLVINVGINLLLVPSFGLWGAIVATGVANVGVLVILLWACHSLEFKTNFGLIVCLILPIGLCLGEPIAVAMSVISIVLAAMTSVLFTGVEKQRLTKLMLYGIQSFAPNLANNLAARVASVNTSQNHAPMPKG
jgi:PST family polysaccharide transporter